MQRGRQRTGGLSLGEAVQQMRGPWGAGAHDGKRWDLLCLFDTSIGNR
jgi:hypothetical protein